MQPPSPHPTYSPLVIATALDLYKFNVSPLERAQPIYDHFKGRCAELDSLTLMMLDYPITELPAASARVYVEHALAKYGDEAQERVAINLEDWDGR